MPAGAERHAGAHEVHQAFHGEWKDREQHERCDDLAGQEVRERRDAADVGPGIDQHDGPQQHPELADQHIGGGRDRGQPHHQIDHEKGRDRQEPEAEEVISPILLHAGIDGGEVPSEPLLHRITPEITRGQKREGRGQRGGRRHQRRTEHEPEQVPGDDGHEQGAGQGQGGQGQVDGDEEYRAAPRMCSAISMDRVALGVEGLEREIGIQIEREKEQQAGEDRDREAELGLVHLRPLA